MSNIIVMDFTVDQNLVGMAAINATKRLRHVNQTVLATMPSAVLGHTKIHFFQNESKCPASELSTKVNEHRLFLADPYSLIGFALKNPDFLAKFPVATQWINAEGEFCYLLLSTGQNQCQGIFVDKASADISEKILFACFEN